MTTTTTAPAGAGPASPTAVPVIEARGLTRTNGKDVRALDGLSFQVEAGTIFALLGPNGAGKSTAVKILITLARYGVRRHDATDNARYRCDPADAVVLPCLPAKPLTTSMTSRKALRR